MEERTFYTDQTKIFLKPSQPDVGDAVTFRFRVGRYQASEILLYVNDIKYEMKWESEKNDFDFYEKTLILTDEISYYFLIFAEGELCFFGASGASRKREDLVPFKLTPGFHIPEWTLGAVIYQVFVDRFRNGDFSNDVKDGEYEYLNTDSKKIEDWNEVPGTFDVCNFHGGDILGIIDKLDYLKDIGIDVLYLSPVFASPSNHGYDIQDYEHIDPHLGVVVDSENIYTNPENLEASDSLFALMVEEAHKKGMRVIIDGVFNHCGHFNKWMDVGGIYKNSEASESGAYNNPASRYSGFFDFKDKNQTRYECWWDNVSLPKLNYENSPELFDYILRIGEKWVSAPYGADGWRLDVAADLGHSAEFNHEFWRTFRQRVKGSNPEAVIIAEHYDDISPWVRGDEWDTVINFRAFMDPVSWYFTGMEKHSDSFYEELLGNAESFENTMKNRQAEFRQSSLHCAMNQLDNHDHSRFVTRTNHVAARLTSGNSYLASRDIDLNIYRNAVIMQMTWPGSPCIYYGDETALPGFTDPDNRRAYPWGAENEDMINFYKRIIAIRKEFDFLRYSSNKIIYAENGVVSYARFTEDEQIIAVFSMNDNDLEIRLPVWISGRAGYIKDDSLLLVVISSKNGADFERKSIGTVYGLMNIKVPARSAMLFYGN